jgi:hypothetical protein
MILPRLLCVDLRLVLLLILVLSPNLCAEALIDGCVSSDFGENYMPIQTIIDLTGHLDKLSLKPTRFSTVISDGKTYYPTIA